MKENLPIYYKKDAGIWNDLDVAFLATVDGWAGLLTYTRDGFIFANADIDQIRFLEGMLKINSEESYPLDYRRGRLVAKFIPLISSSDIVLSVAKNFYPTHVATLSEVEADYTLTMFFTTMQVLPSDIQIFRDTINDIIQADLDFNVNLNIAMSAFTHAELSAFTHGNLIAYTQG